MKLKKLNVEFVFYDRLYKDFLEKISQSHGEYIKNTNGNNLIDVIEWVLRQQKHVEEILNGHNIKFIE